MNVVLWAGGPLGRARELAAEGAHVLAWTETAAADLRAGGVPHETVHLPPDVRDAVDEAAIRWTKRWGLSPMESGRSFRELYAHEPRDGAAPWSWWWFVELFLHHSTEATTHVRRIETFRHVLAATGATALEAHGFGEAEQLLLSRTCTAAGILFEGPVPTISTSTAVAAVRSRAVAELAKCAATAARNTWSRDPEPLAEDGRRRVFFLSHAAFWREQQGALAEHYFGPLIPGVEADGLRPVVVAVGPRAPFRRRGFRERWTDRMAPHGDEPFLSMNRFTDRDVLAATIRAWRAASRALDHLHEASGTTALFQHEGIRFDDLALPDLAAALLLQVPWAVRSYAEMRRALRWARPDAVGLYAESSGWGRAALLAAQAEGVRTVGIQHGILYPKYYSYLHEATEADCPRPDVTAVFGEAAREFLVTRGGYAAGSLVVTGSPRFDELLQQARGQDRVALRAALGAGEADRLVVVASRYRAIRDTHEALGPELARLVRAIEVTPGVRAVVKPHPAEPDTPYREVLAGATRVMLAPAGRGLPEMLAAADLLVSVESLSAVEALVLDLPLLLLSQPSNLRELVDEGVALGVPAGADPGPALRAALFDPDTRARLATARHRYIRHVAAGVDGKAGERLRALLRDVADGRAMVGS